MARKTKTKPETIGARIRAIREDKDMTQEQLAVAVGCAKSTIGRIESVDTKPGDMTVDAIARALGVSVDVLRGGGK